MSKEAMNSIFLDEDLFALYIVIYNIMQIDCTFV